MRRQTIEAIVDNLLRLRAFEHRGDHRDPEAFLHPADAGENLLRFDGNIHRIAIILAGAAIAASIFNILSHQNSAK